MKVAVVFPSVMYREGSAGVMRLIQGIERIGYHELDMLDHVTMGYPTETRRKPFYPPQMPIMEAFTLLSFAAATTSSIRLGTSILILPQRQPTLVAKQVATLDILSQGRMRLGVGTGWQASEYESLHEQFNNRGARMDEAIGLLRAYWGDEHVNFAGKYYQAQEMAMEPKPPQGKALPIWIGGTKDRVLRRVAALGDGWMAMNAPGDDPLADRISRLHDYAHQIDRDPATIGLQMALTADGLSRDLRKRFYAEPDMIRDRMLALKELGFDTVSLDGVRLFRQGYRSSDALLDHLQNIYETLAPDLS